MSRHRVLTVFVLIATTGVVLLWLFDPAHSHIFPPCPVHYFTGLYCPGCGSLRAIHALLHGDLRQAWAMNALTVTMLPLIAYGLASEIYTHFRGPLLTTRVPASWIRALFAVIVLFGIARNLPFHPFDWLAPGALMHF
ncbi:MAG TPA: DUF2752 domain-containing protein [Candidatus Sulfotelmatobacter sp.]|nr:DUF2752 domain-containing protein [Candidatus Sulfotelmatobacter sp.]